ncbi:hypothetical protein BDW59DRAFT_157911 [Aspergillus cavernicola]|uniref:F-box domain-containing protein n=1 Tax=Aspergillus cavernicola TaxID=176166 RepID=A0ABR4IUQ1_9EURO
MAPKRKYSVSHANTSSSPQKLLRQEPEPERKEADPPRYLSFDCASQILGYLKIQDIGRCEQVDRGWRDFIRVWISIVGLRQHFSESWNSEDAKDCTWATNAFKRDARILTRTARSIRKFAATSKYLSIAGDYVDW